MKQAFRTLVFLGVILASFSVGANVYAQQNGEDLDIDNGPVSIKVELKNPFKSEVGDNLYDVAKAILSQVVTPIAGIVCVLAFIYSGFLYVTAGGDKTKITKAHNMLLYTAIGTALLLGAWAIATAVKSTLDSVFNL